jgi:hypothetical protein
MAREVSTENQNKLKLIKTQISESYKYFQENYERYQKFMKFVYDTSLSSDDVSKLLVLKKPNIEFNILEAYINRRIGEFEQHEPSLDVRAADGLSVEQIDDSLLKQIDVMEDHIRDLLEGIDSDGLRTNLFKDTMGGGFSVAEVYTDYVSDLSFEQQIKIERVFDPTLCGFDPLAKTSHKGDGEYAFKIFPRTKEEFEEEWGKDSTVGMAFAKDIGFDGFCWSYKNQEEKILLQVDFYRKERKKERIVKLSNGHVILEKHYEELQDIWNNKLQKMEAAPIIVDRRWSNIETIVLYKLCENKILDVIQTNYKYLPLIFIDGNSVTVKRSKNDSSYQMCRPYVYQAEGVQRLKNFAGQSIASELETLVQHKFMVAMEAIPDDYVDAYTNPQQAQVLAYNAFYEKNPNMPLPPPQVIQRTDTPQIVQATFEGTDRTTMAILGSYDAQQGIVGDRLSGKAISLGAMQSDAASVPYLENFIKGLNRIGQILLDLIPKYYVTPRTIPTRKANGIRSFQTINDPNAEEPLMFSQNMGNSMQIKIEAGLNSTMQKQYALEQITKLMEHSELFANFMNSDGLEILLENIDIRGIDELKVRAAAFMKNMKEQPPKPDPMQEAVEVERERTQTEAQVEMTRIQQKREQAEQQHAVDTAELAIKEQEAEIDFMKAVAELEERRKQMATSENAESSKLAEEAIRLAMDISKHHHEREIDHKTLDHQKKQKASQKQSQKNELTLP